MITLGHLAALEQAMGEHGSPAAPGFSVARVRPQLGPLAQAAGRMAHPLGDIVVRADRNGVKIDVPDGVVLLQTSPY